MATTRTGLFDKVFILHLVCTTVLFLIIIVSYYFIEKRSFDDLLVEKSVLINGLLEISCVDPVVNTIAYDRINQSIEALYIENRDITYIEIYDPTAHIIASVGEIPEVHFTIADISSLNKQNHDLYMSSAVKADDNELITFLEAGGRNLGLIRIKFTRKYLYEQLNRNIMYFFGLFIVAIAVTSLIFNIFTNTWIVSPITEVSKIMKNYGRDELGTILRCIKQYNQTITRDEIGVMSFAFERMISSIIERTEEKEKAEDKYRLIAENIADVIWTLAMDLSFTYISPSVYQLKGYTVDEAMKQTLEEALVPESLENGLKVFQQKMMLLETGDPAGWEPAVLEVEQYCKDGTVIWTSNNVTIFPDEDGLPAGVIGVSHDITSRKRAESALIESERNYRTIFNATSDAIVIHDADTGEIIDVNQGMLDMYGYTYEEAVKADIGRISSGEYPYTPQEAGRKVQETILHGPQSFDWLARRKDTTLFWGEVSLKYIKIIDKRYVLAIVRDVNDRRIAENALAAEKEQLAVTMRSIGDGVITTDISGNIVLLNKVAEDLTGWSSEDAVGMPSDEVFSIINVESRKVCENPIKKVISSGQVIELDSDTILIAKNGEERRIADSGAPILDVRSKMIGVVLVFRDVTEKLRLEKEALKARKLESIGILAGGIAHDFNNILAAILGNINLALVYIEPQNSAYTLLSEAEKASVRAKDLTQQLLTFSRGGEPVLEVTSIAEIITDSSSFVLRGSNTRCNTEFDPALWPVDIDSGQISQVIQNIIINGADAMPRGGVIDIRGKNISERSKIPSSLRGGKYVVVSVEDHGVGIPENIIDNIFDPYFSTKQTGNGLGLAICHSIISRHDGQITVESVLGEGTVFSIYLAASKNQLSDFTNEKNNVITQVHGKVLVMDDEEMVRNIVMEMLRHLGYETEHSADGVEAVGLYKKGLATDTQADLIIMDLTIPGGMGGEEAVKEILAINPEARILVSSGYSNDPIMANYKDYGFYGAIVKPYKMQELKDIIENVLV